MNKSYIIFLIIILASCDSPIISVCSWNLKDFGDTKNDEEITFIAKTIKDFDLIAIQEVVAGEGGEEAIIRLHQELSKSGVTWEYVISDMTSSSAYKAERYAFIWKTNKVRLKGKPWLEKKYHLEIDREPFFASFYVEKKSFTIVNFHAITKAKQPETEVKYLKFLPEEYPALNMIFCGDFNLPQSHSVFNPLKGMGYTPVLVGQKTSLRDRCLDDGCLASEYDNFFFQSSKIELLDKGVIHFYKSFADFDKARQISDHVPIYIHIRIN
jgi:endonuclease/exonuclease/phosphatase family metal-dependent hydrolase